MIIYFFGRLLSKNSIPFSVMNANNAVMKSHPSQNYQMQSELMQLLRRLMVMTFFSWIGFYSFLGKSPSLVGPILGFIYFLLALILIRRLERAHLFYLITAMLDLITTVSLLDASLRMIFVGGSLAGFSLAWIVLIGIGITLFGLWSQFQSLRIQLGASLKHNLKSGRLDLKRGYWNFDMPLHFDQPDQEKSKIQKWKRLSQLSPLVTALVFAIARVIDGGWQMVGMGIGLYVLGFAVALGLSKYLAILVQLRDWEREHNITIKV